MKKFLTTLLAAVLTAGFAALAQPQEPGSEAISGQKRLSCKEKKEIGRATTEKMQSYLELNDKQIKKLDRINKRFADVVGAERPRTIGRPIYGDDRPFYDTPGRPHPSGRNGVPASWFRDEEILNELAMKEAMAELPPEDATLIKRRVKYVKKLGKVLTADQYSTWKSRQLPFPGVDD